MAPFTRARAAGAPHDDDPASYAFLKPSQSPFAHPDARRGRRSSHQSSSVWLSTLAQLILVAAIGVYVLGQLVISTPIYSEYLRNIIADWWGVPGPDGHFEMIVPTYFTLFGVLPVLLSLLLAELIQHVNIRRASSTPLLKIAAFLRRKPRVTATRICWFSFGELLFLTLLFGGNVCVFYYQAIPRLRLELEAHKATQLLTGGAVKTPLPFERYLKVFGVALGLNCMFNMAFLFLPATRNCAWMEILNISYVNGIKYHRWLGIITVVTAVGHCVGFYWAYLLEGTWRDKCLPCFDCDLDTPRGRRVWLNVFGELALLIFVVIGVTSIPHVRRKMYNLFYYVHQLFVLSVVFLVMHWAPSIWWLAPTFAVYVITRSLSSTNSFTPVQVKEFTTLDNDIVKIVINRSAARDGDYKVGQFVYLNVPSISKLQWHAFTIGSSPRTNATTLTILLKSLGDWTKDLVEYSEECKKTNVLPTVFMDGFYGASLEMYDEYSTLCLVGGGIGVTPLFAILEDLVAKLSHHEPLTQRVFFIFTFRELSLLEEIHPILAEIRVLDPHEDHFSFHFNLTRTPGREELHRMIHQNAHVAWNTRLAATASSAKPFAESLKSRKLKSFVYFTVFTYATSALVFLEFRPTDASESDQPSLWPLQSLTKASVLLLCGIIMLFFVAAERLLKNFAAVRALRANTSPADFYELLLPKTKQIFPSQAPSTLFTVEDLLHEYRVEVGRRPNMNDLMAKVHRAHVYSHRVGATTKSVASDAIGVFVSGPEALKSATAHAIADIGSTNFDLHEEEFEL